MSIKTPADYINIIDQRIEQNDRNKKLNRKSVIDSAYTTGNPKVKRAGETAAANVTKQSLIPYNFPSVMLPSESVIETPVADGSVIAGKLGSPYEYSNHYAMTWPNPSSLTTVGFGSVNQVIAWHFPIDKPFVISSVVYELVGVNAGAHVSIGLYSNTKAIRYFTTGAQAGDTAGVTFNSLTPVAVSPGMYWIAICSDDTLVTFRAVTLDALARAIMNNGAVHLGTNSVGGSGGAVPSTLSVISDAAVSPPYIKLQG